MCVCNLSLPPNDISRRRKHGYYRIRYWVNSSIVYTYCKESRFALFFSYFPHHIKEFLCFSMSPRLYLQDDCASLIRDVLLINVAVEKIDLLQWELSFSLFLFGTTTALSVTEPPLNLLPSPHFTFCFLTCDAFDVCVYCMSFLTHFPISLFFLTRLAYVRNYALN